MIGKRDEIPRAVESNGAEFYDTEGGWITTPGLIDRDTNLVYSGSPAREFELRLQGATYRGIASQGGRIKATVAATREADEQSNFK